LLPRKNYAADFLWQQLNFGQQHAAARQIKRTSVDFQFLARYGAGCGKNAV
jgi:hypothetical protein